MPCKHAVLRTTVDSRMQRAYRHKGKRGKKRQEAARRTVAANEQRGKEPLARDARGREAGRTGGEDVLAAQHNTRDEQRDRRRLQPCMLLPERAGAGSRCLAPAPLSAAGVCAQADIARTASQQAGAGATACNVEFSFQQRFLQVRSTGTCATAIHTMYDVGGVCEQSIPCLLCPLQGGSLSAACCLPAPPSFLPVHRCIARSPWPILQPLPLAPSASCACRSPLPLCLFVCVPVRVFPLRLVFGVWSLFPPLPPLPPGQGLLC